MGRSLQNAPDSEQDISGGIEEGEIFPSPLRTTDHLDCDKAGEDDIGGGDSEEVSADKPKPNPNANTRRSPLKSSEQKKRRSGTRAKKSGEQNGDKSQEHQENENGELGDDEDEVASEGKGGAVGGFLPGGREEVIDLTLDNLAGEGREMTLEAIISSSVPSEKNGANPKTPKKKKKKKEKASTEGAEAEAKTGTPFSMLGGVLVKTGRLFRGTNGEQLDAEAGVDELADQNNLEMGKLLRPPRYFEVAADSDAECFNCGEIGHLAWNCTAEARQKPCFICGEFGHEGRDCSQKVQCFACGKLGHIARECPNKDDQNRGGRGGSPSGEDPVCLVCGRADHTGMNCARGYDEEEMKSVQCYICHRFGHFMCADIAMQVAEEVTCFNCGAAGHAGEGCTKFWQNSSGRGDGDGGGRRGAGVFCINCGGEGHKAWACSEGTNGTAKRQKKDPLAELFGAVQSAKACFNCGQLGHLRNACPQSRPPEIPSTSYDHRTTFAGYAPQHGLQDRFGVRGGNSLGQHQWTMEETRTRNSSVSGAYNDPGDRWPYAERSTYPRSNEGRPSPGWQGHSNPLTRPLPAHISSKGRVGNGSNQESYPYESREQQYSSGVPSRESGAQERKWDNDRPSSSKGRHNEWGREQSSRDEVFLHRQGNLFGHLASEVEEPERREGRGGRSRFGEEDYDGGSKGYGRRGGGYAEPRRESERGAPGGGGGHYDDESARDYDTGGGSRRGEGDRQTGNPGLPVGRLAGRFGKKITEDEDTEERSGNKSLGTKGGQRRSRPKKPYDGGGSYPQAPSAHGGRGGQRVRFR
eukprot:TRINITY_DN29351_c0_g1_i1.p1 TRINITY_DN29351_c0_g1~~TRINITY_DN29351_c0_g1_i1.p1  ORF type:complete len:808 (-),score=110.88 TRINITY_DN29351_c0_g1_i1:361-2784(-)